MFRLLAAHSGDGGRPPPESRRSPPMLVAAPVADPADPWPTKGASWKSDTTPQLNTHSIESREVHYRWHPWFGRRVWIYSIRTGRATASARCGLEAIQCSK